MPHIVFSVRTPPGEPVAGAAVLAAYPDGRYRTGVTNAEGEWGVDLYRTDLEMRVMAAAKGHLPTCHHIIIGDEQSVPLVLPPSPGKNGIVFTSSTGHIPNLEGRLNPVRDGERAYVYTDNIAIDGRVSSPAHFEIGQPMNLLDVYGNESTVIFLAVEHQFSLLEYTDPQPYPGV